MTMTFKLPPGGIEEYATLFPDWDGLKAKRVAMDAFIVMWADGLKDWLSSCGAIFSPVAAHILMNITGPSRLS